MFIFGATLTIWGRLEKKIRSSLRTNKPITAWEKR